MREGKYNISDWVRDVKWPYREGLGDVKVTSERTGDVKQTGEGANWNAAERTKTLN